jgi:DNA repair protein RecO (recombination protein O)
VAILKTKAIILNGWRFRETSKILSLYTRNYGKVKVIAKGAFSQKSKFRGCLENLTHIQVVYYDKRTRDIQLLSQVDLINPFIHILGDLERTTLGLAIVELVDKAVIGEEPFPHVFDLLVSVLKLLDEGKGFIEGALWFFEGKFIDLMGYKPTWDSCLKCNHSLSSVGGFFQPHNGGLLCNRCGRVGGGLVVRGETLEILYWLQKCSLEEVNSLNPSSTEKMEIRKMFNFYFKSHIENFRNLKSLGIYYSLDMDD